MMVVMTNHLDCNQIAARKIEAQEENAKLPGTKP